MTPRVCKIKHNPPKSYGDCVAACVATLIDRDDVPHTFDGRDAESAWSDLRAYLNQHGMTLSVFASEEDPRDHMGVNNPDTPYMLMCSTSEGNHAVVCVGSEVFHDPSWYKMIIRGGTDMGVWVVGVITCLK